MITKGAARRRTRTRHSVAAAGLVALALIGGSAGSAPTDRRVSQNNRKFDPGEITVKQGETVQIVNDDVVLHHAYLESARFSLDSGDQEPGATVDVAFYVPGTFEVLCGIHPKMKLRVRVQ